MEVESKDISKEIIVRLARLQSDIDYLKRHVKDEDVFLSGDEEVLLEESYENEKEGNLLSSEDAKKELGI